MSIQNYSSRYTIHLKPLNSAYPYIVLVEDNQTGELHETSLWTWYIDSLFRKLYSHPEVFCAYGGTYERIVYHLAVEYVNDHPEILL